jgi:hypothetical protein
MDVPKANYKLVHSDQEFDLFFEEIKEAFKTGTVYICPDCKNVTSYVPNPFYYHECEHCGRKGYYSDLHMQTSEDLVERIIHNYYKNETV